MHTPIRLLLIDDTPDDRTLASRALKRGLPGVEIREVRDAATLGRAFEEAPYSRGRSLAIRPGCSRSCGICSPTP